VSGALPLEPWVTWRDLGVGRGGRWDDVDAVVSRLLGRPALGIPSVRVGLTWALEYLGLRRHRDHALVPRFMGRCILTALTHRVLPVEVPTDETRAVITVDQFGLRHDVAAVGAEARRRDWVLLEDSPCGIGADEAPSPGALARFVGLAKALPVVQGGAVVSDDARFAEFVRVKRRHAPVWGTVAWTLMVLVRARRRATGSSVIADLAYELYPHVGGGSARLRANVLSVLARLDAIAALHASRLRRLSEALGERVLLPDASRVGYVVPFLCDEIEPAAVEAFHAQGFDASPYHVDVARNLLAPRYARALLIPLSLRVPEAGFARLVDALAALAPREAVPLLASASTQPPSVGFTN
jgi:hypothetical protein